MNPLEISSDQFRNLAERVTRLAAEYLETLDSRPIHPSVKGDKIDALFQAELPEKGLEEAALTGLEDIVRNSRAQNGRLLWIRTGIGRAGGRNR